MRKSARPGCPVELTLDRLAGKWKTILLARLKSGPQRYADLRASVPGLSDKVLTDRLHELRADGLVDQDPQGRYHLSEEGETLRPVLQSLYDWGQDRDEPR